MCIRTSRKSAKTYRAVAMRGADLSENRKEGVVEKPEDNKGYGLGAGGRSDRGGEAGSRVCTERNWHCGNSVRMAGHNHLTGNVRVVGMRLVHVLDRKVMNE